MWIEELYTPNGSGCLCGGADCHAKDTYKHFLSGDTVIGSYTYSKIYKTGGRVAFMYSMPICPPNVTYSPVWTYYSNIYSGALRQDTTTKEIFYRINNTDELLYDFDIQLGDTLTQMPYLRGEETYVSMIDSVWTNNQYRKRFWLSTVWGMQQNHVALIEGIGSTYGLLSSLTEPFEDTYVLKCAEDNGTNVYQNPNYTCDVPNGITELSSLSFEISPNPSDGIFYIQGAEKLSGIDVTDMTGRKILSLRGPDVTGKIDLSKNSIGIYLIRAEDREGRTAMSKLMLE